jgi:ubiquinone/menaquinone biosynthesis C-methylase UbiE
VRLRDAITMLAGSGLSSHGPAVWADLGCGTGTFTRALADALAPGSTIHAMDLDRAALSRLPARHAEVTIHPVHGDFMTMPWPFGNVDGILMANSLHYIHGQEEFIWQCTSQMKARWQLVIVEYDLTRANQWVPYPVSRSRLVDLFRTVGDVSITFLGSRPSLYHRAPLYAALVARGKGGLANSPR